MTKQNRICGMALLLAALAGGWARAQSRFDGSAGTGWNNTDNWTPAGIPTLTTPVIIGTTNTAVGASGSPMTAVIGPGDTCEAASVTLGELPFNSGTLDMSGGTLTLPAAGTITLGAVWSSLGMLRVAESGVITNLYMLSIGNPGYGDAVVSGTGRVYASYLSLSSTGGVASSLTVRDAGYASGLYYVGYPDGIATVTLSNNATASGPAAYYTCIGTFERSIGRFYIRDNALYNGINRPLTLGGGLSGVPTANDRTGIVEVSESGVITNCNITIGNCGAGLMTVSGTGKVYSIVSMGSTGAVPCSLTVRDSGYVQSLGYVGQYAGGVATVTLSNNATAGGWGGAYTCIGAAGGTIGRLLIRDNAVFNGAGAPIYLGGHNGGASQPNNCTGIVEVSDSAVITNCSSIFLGDTGSGQMTVSGAGKVYLSVAVTLLSTGAVPCFLTVTNTGTVQGLYRIGGADGAATVTLSGDSTGGACTSDDGRVGYGARSIGRLYVRNNARYDGSSRILYVGSGVNSTGIVEIAGNAVFTNCSALSIAYGAGSVGRLDLLGGKLHQAGTTTVGGGTAGDRYGLVTISNATFGGSTAATVWTNGFVELTGTGSVFRCNTFTCRGGSLTNHVRAMSGGLDITGSAGTSLVVTNGGRVHLSFEKHPPVATNLWGLRWMGNNHSNDLQQLMDAGALTWSKSVTADVKIYTNATHTWIGYQAPAESPAGSVVMVY